MEKRGKNNKAYEIDPHSIGTSPQKNEQNSRLLGTQILSQEGVLQSLDVKTKVSHLLEEETSMDERLYESDLHNRFTEGPKKTGVKFVSSLKGTSSQ